MGEEHLNPMLAWVREVSTPNTHLFSKQGANGRLLRAKSVGKVKVRVLPPI
jgi:hypothetical protein